MEQKEKTIAEILRNVPKGTKLYSPLFGVCTLERVDDDVIRVAISDGTVYMFTETGCFFRSEEAECLLFPSKDNRSWADFEYNHQFKPFDKVVVRDNGRGSLWTIDHFSFYDVRNQIYQCAGGTAWRHCLPYNEMTAKLIGTTDELNG
jgi:hypothetical protein